MSNDYQSKIQEMDSLIQQRLESIRDEIENKKYMQLIEEDDKPEFPNRLRDKPVKTDRAKTKQIYDDFFGPYRLDPKDLIKKYCE